MWTQGRGSVPGFTCRAESVLSLHAAGAGEAERMPAIFPGPLALAIESSGKYSLNQVLLSHQIVSEPINIHSVRPLANTQFHMVV